MSLSDLGRRRAQTLQGAPRTFGGLALLLLAFACAGQDGSTDDGSGGGAASSGTGGDGASGGSPSGGSSSGGSSAGGSSSSGGDGGGSQSGGSGAASSGGGSSGGQGSGSRSSGGEASGGESGESGGQAGEGAGGAGGAPSTGPCYEEACSGTCQGSCDDGFVCDTQPIICTADIAPFCGCDGETFMSSSGCPDRAYAHQGACETDTAVDCDARNIVCQPIVPPEPCPEGQVHSVVEGCHGECVPVGRCACSEPEQCPDPKGINEFTCANNRGRCTPWLG